MEAPRLATRQKNFARYNSTKDRSTSEKYQVNATGSSAHRTVPQFLHMRAFTSTNWLAPLVKKLSTVTSSSLSSIDHQTRNY